MKRKKIIIAVSIIILLFAVIAIANSIKGSKENVVTDVVKKGHLQKTASITGEIVSNNNYSTMLNPSLKITSINYKEGEDVKKGSVILTYDSSDIKSQLEKARLNLKYQKEMLNEIKSQSESPSPSAQKSSGMSPSDSNKLLAASSQKASTKSQELQIDIAENDVKSLEKKLESLKVISPINGKITKLNASKDSIPSQGAILQINDTSNLKVKLSLSQYDSALIKKGQKVSIKISGLSKELSGEVSFVSGVAENLNASSNDKAILADVTINGDKSDIKIGFEAECLITLSEKECTYVSFDSIKKDKTGTYLFTLENNTVKKKYIETGLETDFEIEVLSGLKEGEKYIKNPSESLKEGVVATEASTKESSNE